jgi:hypothetical protein
MLMYSGQLIHVYRLQYGKADPSLRIFRVFLVFAKLPTSYRLEWVGEFHLYGVASLACGTKVAERREAWRGPDDPVSIVSIE